MQKFICAAITPIDYLNLLLPFVSCTIAGEKDYFLVDSGSTFSVLSVTYKRLLKDNPKTVHPPFVAVNGSSVQIFGSLHTDITYRRIKFTHTFYVASVLHNLLGFDFQVANNLILVPHNKTLVSLDRIAMNMTSHLCESSDGAQLAVDLGFEGYSRKFKNIADINALVSSLPHPAPVLTSDAKLTLSQTTDTENKMNMVCYSLHPWEVAANCAMASCSSSQGGGSDLFR